MEFRLRHPDDPFVRAKYGIDERGPWAEIPYAGGVVRYDAASEGYDAADPMFGLLMFLSVFGYVATGDIADAHAWLDDPDHAWPGRRRPTLCLLIGPKRRP